jgi:16S rRNA (cytidine1402-2'-O)-methyltransferase
VAVTTISNFDTGVLYVVATPIGNLEDLSVRALNILRSVDYILAEDTRRFTRLASSFQITAKLKSYHEHNEKQISDFIATDIRTGKTVALVSDAGTPTISDPGYRLINACQKIGVKIIAIPGACALVAALSVSGFETDSFCFNGFLSPKSGKRLSQLSEALASQKTTIFYESPHRIIKTIGALVSLDSEREVFLARELTKIHEELFRGTASEALAMLNAKSSIKGEFVLIIRRE